METIAQHPINFTYYKGWYGDLNNCEPFMLESLGSSILHKVYVISNTGTSRLVYNSSVPSRFQRFSELKCGYSYELVFKPGTNTNIVIPGFVFNKIGGGDLGRINESAEGGVKTSEKNIFKFKKPIVCFWMVWWV